MKKSTLFILVIAALALAGCQEKSTTAPSQNADRKVEIPAGAGKKGTVAQTMNAGGYTYIEVDSKGEKTWLALPEMKVAVGDKIEYQETTPMVNYNSKTLNRKFEKILFVQGVKIDK